MSVHSYLFVKVSEHDLYVLYLCVCVCECVHVHLFEGNPTATVLVYLTWMV